MDCILCKSNEIETLCQIIVNDLVKIYFNWLQHDISDEFKGTTTISFLECKRCGLRFFNPCTAGSSHFYEILHEKMGADYYQEDKMEYELAARVIKENDSVLDVGSGKGLFRKYVKGRYLGLDFNPSAIAQAAADGINVVNESVDEHVNNLTSKYSVVAAFQVLEHMPNPGRFIQSCLGALQSGGLLILAVPSEDSFVSLQENSLLNMPPHHVSRWTDRSLVSLENQFGLTLISLQHEPLAAIHFEWYIQLLSNRTIRAILNLTNHKLIDVSITKKIVDRLSSIVKPSIRKVIASPALWPQGHSVTAVYKKRSDG